MINIGGNIAEMSVGNISIGSAYVGNQLVWEKTSDIPGYTRLSRLENTSDVYIDTEYYPNAKTKVICDMQFTSVIKQSILFGTSNAGNVWFSLYVNNYNTYTVQARSGSTAESRTSTTVNTARHTFELDATLKKFYIDGTLIRNLTRGIGASAVSTYPIAIWRYTTGGAASHSILYSFKIYDDDILVRDFIPVQEELTGDYGVWDKVNEKFHKIQTDTV